MTDEELKNRFERANNLIVFAVLLMLGLAILITLDLLHLKNILCEQKPTQSCQIGGKP